MLSQSVYIRRFAREQSPMFFAFDPQLVPCSLTLQELNVNDIRQTKMCLGTGKSLQPNPPNGVRKSFYLTHLSYGESILGEPYQIQKPVGVPPAPLIKLKFRCVQYTALDGSALPFNIIRLMASIVCTRTAPNLVPSQQVTLRFVCLFPPQRVPILIKKWGDVFSELVHIFLF